MKVKCFYNNLLLAMEIGALSFLVDYDIAT